MPSRHTVGYAELLFISDMLVVLALTSIQVELVQTV